MRKVRRTLGRDAEQARALGLKFGAVVTIPDYGGVKGDFYWSVTFPARGGVVYASGAVRGEKAARAAIAGKVAAR